MSDDGLMEAVMEAQIMMNEPRLIDIGRGVVDAREIVAVNTIYPEDYRLSLTGAKMPHPAYVQSEVVFRYGIIYSPLAADAIVARWRLALGGLPTPIGGAEDAA